MELIRLHMDPDLTLRLAVWFPILVLAAIVAIVTLLFLRFFSFAWLVDRSYVIDEAEIGIGNQKIKIKPSMEDAQIAYQLWVEMSTRKIALPIDPRSDVIVEIYASWYEFFRTTRELVKTVPIAKVRSSQTTRDFVSVAVEVLNEGLRPHLTKWQAKLRAWYQKELETARRNGGASAAPQEIQSRFPGYRELIEDMLAINQRLTAYRDLLRRIAFGDGK